jgi:hypothetical protein
MKALASEMIRLAFKPEIKPDALYTYKEVVLLTSAGRRTIERAIENGRLNRVYIGSEPRVLGASIFQWLEKGGKTGRSKKQLLEEAGG